MNTVLGAQSTSETQRAASTERMRDVTTKTLQFIFELLPGERKDVDVVDNPQPYKWNMIPPELVLHADDEENQLVELIPPHNCIKLALM